MLGPLLVAWLASLGLLGIVGVQRSVPLEQLFLDPTSVAGAPWYAGALSSLGIVGWTAAAVAAIGGSWVASQTDRPSAAAFLGAGALAGTVLLVDDLFRLHSAVLAPLVGAKLPALALVLLPTVIWVGRFRHEIARTRWLMLVAAGLGAAGSTIVDVTLAPDGATGLLAEDGAKLLGIVAWTTYFVTTTVDISRSTIRAAKTATSAPIA